MIRERLDQDLDPLCAVLRALETAPASLRGVDPPSWLLEHDDAERSWVFDQAPVVVTPTRNVVGHVQIYPATDEVLVVGKLVVRPGRHAEAIGRFLLRESVRYVRTRGRVPVVDLRETAFPADFFARAGFGVEEGDEAGVLLVHRT